MDSRGMDEPYEGQRFAELRAYREKLLERYRQVGPEMVDAAARVAGQRQPSGSSRAAYVLSHLRDLMRDTFAPLIADLSGAQLEEDFARSYASLDGASLLQTALDFQAIHRQILSCLQDLPRAAWSRSVRHPNAGVRTLQWWVETSLVTIDASLQQVRQEIKSESNR